LLIGMPLSLVDAAIATRNMPIRKMILGILDLFFMRSPFLVVK